MQRFVHTIFFAFVFFNGFTFHSVLQFPLILSAFSMRVEQPRHGIGLYVPLVSFRSIITVALEKKLQYFAKWRKLVPEVMKKESNGCAFIVGHYCLLFIHFTSLFCPLPLQHFSLFCNSRSGTSFLSALSSCLLFSCSCQVQLSTEFPSDYKIFCLKNNNRSTLLAAAFTFRCVICWRLSISL